MHSLGEVSVSYLGPSSAAAISHLDLNNVGHCTDHTLDHKQGALQIVEVSRDKVCIDLFKQQWLAQWHMTRTNFSALYWDGK